MAGPIQYTNEDRAMLRAVHDALIGTLEKRGLITRIDIIESRIDAHVSEAAGEVRRAAEAAARVAEEASVAAAAAAAAAAGTRSESPRRFLYDILKYAAGSVVALLATGVVATYLIGLRITLGH